MCCIGVYTCNYIYMYLYLLNIKREIRLTNAMNNLRQEYFAINIYREMDFDNFSNFHD